MMAHEIETVPDLLQAWDNGDTVWTVELGGLGPGYEQALQVAAVEFSRACKDLPNIKHDDKESTERFTKKCEEVLHELDKDLGGLSGAQFGAARWLAFQWCFNGGPGKLMERAKKQKRETILISKHWPKAPEPKVTA